MGENERSMTIYEDFSRSDSFHPGSGTKSQVSCMGSLTFVGSSSFRVFIVSGLLGMRGYCLSFIAQFYHNTISVCNLFPVVEHDRMDDFLKYGAGREAGICYIMKLASYCIRSRYLF